MPPPSRKPTDHSRPRDHLTPDEQVALVRRQVGAMEESHKVLSDPKAATADVLRAARENIRAKGDFAYEKGRATQGFVASTVGDVKTMLGQDNGNSARSALDVQNRALGDLKKIEADLKAGRLSQADARTQARALVRSVSEDFGIDGHADGRVRRVEQSNLSYREMDKAALDVGGSVAGAVGHTVAGPGGAAAASMAARELGGVMMETGARRQTEAYARAYGRAQDGGKLDLSYGVDNLTLLGVDHVAGNDEAGEEGRGQSAATGTAFNAGRAALDAAGLKLGDKAVKATASAAGGVLGTGLLGKAASGYVGTVATNSTLAAGGGALSVTESMVRDGVNDQTVQGAGVTARQTAINLALQPIAALPSRFTGGSTTATILANTASDTAANLGAAAIGNQLDGRGFGVSEQDVAMSALTSLPSAANAGVMQRKAAALSARQPAGDIATPPLPVGDGTTGSAEGPTPGGGLAPDAAGNAQADTAQPGQMPDADTLPDPWSQPVEGTEAAAAPARPGPLDKPVKTWRYKDPISGSVHDMALYRNANEGISLSPDLAPQVADRARLSAPGTPTGSIRVSGNQLIAPDVNVRLMTQRPVDSPVGQQETVYSLYATWKADASPGRRASAVPAGTEQPPSSNVPDADVPPSTAAELARTAPPEPPQPLLAAASRPIGLLPARTSSSQVPLPDGATIVGDGRVRVSRPVDPANPDLGQVGYTFDEPVRTSWDHTDKKTGEVTQRTLYSGSFLTMPESLQAQAPARMQDWQQDPYYTHVSADDLKAGFSSPQEHFYFLTEQKSAGTGTPETLIGMGASVDAHVLHPQTGALREGALFSHFAAMPGKGAGRPIAERAKQDVAESGRGLYFETLDPRNVEPGAPYGAGGYLQPDMWAVHAIDPFVREIPGRTPLTGEIDLGAPRYIPLPGNGAAWSGPTQDWKGNVITDRSGAPIDLPLPFGTTSYAGINSQSDMAAFGPPSAVFRPDGSSFGLGSNSHFMSGWQEDGTPTQPIYARDVSKGIELYQPPGRDTTYSIAGKPRDPEPASASFEPLASPWDDSNSQPPSNAAEPAQPATQSTDIEGSQQLLAAAPRPIGLLPERSSWNGPRTPEGQPRANGRYTVKAPGNPDDPDLYNVGYTFQPPATTEWINVNPKTGGKTVRTLTEGPFVAMPEQLQAEMTTRIGDWNTDPDYTGPTPEQHHAAFSSPHKRFYAVSERPLGAAAGGDSDRLIGIGATLSAHTWHAGAQSLQPAQYFQHFAADRTAGGAGRTIAARVLQRGADNGEVISFLSVDPRNKEPGAPYGEGGFMQPDHMVISNTRDPNVRVLPGNAHLPKDPVNPPYEGTLPQGGYDAEHHWTGERVVDRNGNPVPLSFPFGTQVYAAIDPPSVLHSHDNPIYLMKADGSSFPLSPILSDHQVAPTRSPGPLQVLGDGWKKVAGAPDAFNTWGKQQLGRFANWAVQGPLMRNSAQARAMKVAENVNKTGTSWGEPIQFADVQGRPGRIITVANEPGAAPVADLNGQSGSPRYATPQGTEARLTERVDNPASRRSRADIRAAAKDLNVESQIRLPEEYDDAGRPGILTTAGTGAPRPAGPVRPAMSSVEPDVLGSPLTAERSAELAAQGLRAPTVPARPSTPERDPDTGAPVRPMAEQSEASHQARLRDESGRYASRADRPDPTKASVRELEVRAASRGLAGEPSSELSEASRTKVNRRLSDLSQDGKLSTEASAPTAADAAAGRPLGAVPIGELRYTFGGEAPLPYAVAQRAQDVTGQSNVVKAKSAAGDWLNDPDNAALAVPLKTVGSGLSTGARYSVIPAWNYGVKPAWKYVVKPTLYASPLIVEAMVRTGNLGYGSFPVPDTQEDFDKLTPLQYAVARRANWIPTPRNPDGTPTKGGEMQYWAVKVPGTEDAIASRYWISRNETPYPDVFKGNKLSIPGASGAPSWLDIADGRLYYLAHDLKVDRSQLVGWTFGTQDYHVNTMAIHMESRAATPYYDLQIGKGARPIDFNVGLNHGGQVAMLSMEIAAGPSKIATGQVYAAPWTKFGIGSNGLTFGINPIGAPGYFSFTTNPAYGEKGLHPSIRGKSASEVGEAYERDLK